MRRVPMAEGYNYQTYIYSISRIAYSFWPLTLHMIHTNKASEQAQIEVINYILNSGFGIR